MNSCCLRPIWIVCVAAVTLAVSWAVHSRADAPSGRYISSNGTVYDTKTKLTWQQYNSTSKFDTSTDAQTYCTNLPLLDGTGWRLPSMKELQTIVDRKRANPAIDPIAFPGTPTGTFGTSSPKVGSASIWWHVDFSFGSTGSGYGLVYLRCVR